MLKRKMKIRMLLLVAGILAVGLGLMAIGDIGDSEEVRYGAWLDEIIAIVVDHDVAVPMIEAGALDVFAHMITCPETLRRVEASPYMEAVRSFGAFRPLAFNTAGTPEEPFFADGRLNPFAIRRIRQAMHWLVDRDYVADEIWGGLAIPRFFPISPVFPDYTRLIETARRLELYYAHNPEKAERIITEEMEKLGAVRIDGIWHWNDEPVVITLMIRVEDARLHLGHYATRLMEDVGFKTKQMFVTSGEAAPHWMRGDPYDGVFHIHTPGWATRRISRDQAGTINHFFTPRGFARPLWKILENDPEFCELSLRLALRDFETMEERTELFSRVLELAMEDAWLVHVVNCAAFKPHRADLVFAADLAGGLAGSALWPYTLQFIDPVTEEPIVGGKATIGMPDLLVNPWNPIAGSAWLFDRMFHRATTDWGTVADPFTGLRHPQRIKRAEVFVREGLTVDVTLDWVDLHFVPEANEVHPDAWVDWDATEQRFITLSEAREKEGWDPAMATADIKVRVYYPADLFETVKWHCASPLSIGDFVMDMILSFDRPHPDSRIYDPAAVARHRTFMRHFRGVRIVSEDPLIIESYTTRAFLDAEVIAAGWTWFPLYRRGPAGWHNLVPGILAETNKELAFSSSKAAYLGVEWMSFIAGPSLPILERHLADAKAGAYIPFYPTLGQFITREEAAARYAALFTWVYERGHFWIGTGPFYLVEAHPLERVVHLNRNPDFPDRADRWAGFDTPKISGVDVTGPTMVRAGEEAAFDIVVTFEGEPYPVADIDVVTYLLLDVTGAIVYVGTAVAIRDGLWQAVIPAEKTAALALGTTTLEVVVVSMLVAIPTFDAATFVLLP